MSAAVAVLLVVAGMIFGALAMGKRSQPASKARKKSSCGKRVTASKIKIGRASCRERGWTWV